MTDRDRVLVLGGGLPPLRELAAQTPGTVVVDDLESCLAELGAGGAFALVLIDGTRPRPLAAARRIREADRHVDLVLAVRTAEVAAMRARLPLLPDAGDVGVLAADVATEQLQRAVEEAVAASRRRRRVRGPSMRSTATWRWEARPAAHRVSHARSRSTTWRPSCAMPPTPASPSTSTVGS